MAFVLRFLLHENDLFRANNQTSKCKSIYIFDENAKKLQPICAHCTKSINFKLPLRRL